MIDKEICFIDPNRNDKFSSLKGLDLQELIIQIERFYLMYRKTLNLPEEVTFGMEIEYEGVFKYLIDKYIERNDIIKYWTSDKDRSLMIGGEIISPKMHDTPQTWEQLQVVCKFLKRVNAVTTKNAGGHIHMGAHILGDSIDNWRNFLKLYIAYESVLFRFLYGDKISARKKLFKYARPISDELLRTISCTNTAKTVSEIKYYIPKGKYQAINFNYTDFYEISEKNKNTIEFREPNATVEEIIWQNNVNALSKMMLSSKSSTFDIDFIDYKLSDERVSSSKDFFMYNEVCLKNALEFVDIIFDNNLDKVYFLRQYIKGFADSNGLKEAINSTNFINRRRIR